MAKRRKKTPSFCSVLLLEARKTRNKRHEISLTFFEINISYLINFVDVIEQRGLEKHRQYFEQKLH